MINAAYHQSILEHAVPGFVVTQNPFNILESNLRLQKLLELSDIDLINLGWDGLAPQQSERLSAHLNNTRELGFDTAVFQIANGNGKLILTELQSSLIKSETDETLICTCFQPLPLEKATQGGLELLINNTETSLLLVDSSFEVLAFNRMFEQEHNAVFCQQVQRGVSFLHFLDEQVHERVIEMLNAALNGRTELSEFNITDSDGLQKTFLSTYAPAKNEAGEIMGISINIRNITTQKEIESQFDLQEQKYKALIEYATDGVAIVTADGKPLYVSPTVTKILGYSIEEIMKMNFIEYLDPDDLEDMLDVWAFVVAEPGNAINNKIFRVKHRNGSWRYIEKNITNLLHEPSVAGIVDNFRDVTETILAQKSLTERQAQLEQAEENYREIFDKACDGIFIFDPLQGRIVDLNQQACEIVGYSKEEVLLANPEQFMYDQMQFTRELAIEKITKAIQEGPQGFEWIAKHRNGTIHWVEVNIKKASIAGSTKILAFFRLIDDRKKIEAQKDFEQKKNEALINTTEDLIWSIDRDLNLITANKAYVQLVESIRPNTVGNGISVMPDEKTDPTYPLWKELYQKALQGEQFFQEIYYPATFTRPAEWAEVNFNPIIENHLVTGVACFQKNITTLKTNGIELINLNKKLETAQQLAHLGYWEMNLQQEQLFWTNEVYRIWGVDPGSFEVNFDNFFNSIHPEDQTIFSDSQGPALKGDGKQDVEYRIILPNGEIRHVHEIGELVYDENGNPIRLEGTVQDITHRKTAEEQLRLSEENYRILFQLSPLPMWVYDLKDYSIIDVNESAIQKYGYSREEFLQLKQEDLRPASELPALMESRKKFHNIEGAIYFGIYLHTTKDGTRMKVESYGHRYQSNNKSCMMVVANDVTLREEAFKQLRSTNSRFEMVTRATSDAIWEWNMENNNVYWGESHAFLFGRIETEGQAAIETEKNRIHPDDLKRLQQEGRKVFENQQEIWHFEHRYLKSDGQYALVQNKALLVKNDAGNVVRLMGAMQDITRKREEELRMKMLESVVTHTKDAILITKAEPIERSGPEIIYVNAAFTQITGYTPEETIGKTPRFLQGPNTDSDELLRLKEALKKWQPVEVTLVNYKKDKTPFWNNMSISPLADETGFYTHWIAIERDVTAQKNSEISLNQLNQELSMQAKELAVSNADLEQFAYIASHDLQEPLRMISSFLSLLGKRYQDALDDTGKKYIHFAVDGAKRMRQIILDLLEISKIGRTKELPEMVSLEELVDEIRLLHARQLEEERGILKTKDLPTLLTFKTPIRQVLQNLISNGLKYAKPGIPPVIRIAAKENDKQWEFTVCDNGIGIDPEYFDKIFVIFQRLHHNESIGGTGLGLAITKKIVEHLGGKIWVTSQPGKGSTFHFTILKREHEFVETIS